MCGGVQGIGGLQGDTWEPQTHACFLLFALFSYYYSILVLFLLSFSINPVPQFTVRKCCITIIREIEKPAIPKEQVHPTQLFPSWWWRWCLWRRRRWRTERERGERTTSPPAAAFLSRTEVVATSNIMCSGSPDVTTCTSEAIRLSSLQI